jgi:hypothetical protein
VNKKQVLIQIPDELYEKINENPVSLTAAEINSIFDAVEKVVKGGNTARLVNINDLESFEIDEDHYDYWSGERYHTTREVVEYDDLASNALPAYVAKVPLPLDSTEGDNNES